MHIKTQIKYAEILKVMSMFVDVNSTNLLISEVHVEQKENETTFWATDGQMIARLKIDKPAYFNFPLLDDELVSREILDKLKELFDANIGKRETTQSVLNYKRIMIDYLFKAMRAFKKINSIMGVKNNKLGLDFYFQNENSAMHLERVNSVPSFVFTILIMPVRKYKEVK